jgi:hypothetical protein
MAAGWGSRMLCLSPALHGRRASAQRCLNTPVGVSCCCACSPSHPQVLTGLGPVSQLSVSTGLPRIAAQLLLSAFVVHGLYAFSPSTPTWSSPNRHDLLRRPKGVPRAFINPFTEPGRFFGFRCGCAHSHLVVPHVSDCLARPTYLVVVQATCGCCLWIQQRRQAD